MHISLVYIPLAGSLPFAVSAFTRNPASGKFLRTRRFLQDQNDAKETTPTNVIDLDPFDFLDGISSITYSPGNSSTTAFGYADIPNQIPMAADVRMPIGSNSKLFTAVAIYQLHERGLLDVDADIATMLNETDFEAFGLHGIVAYCPQVGYNAPDQPCETITLKQLLSMSSGIYDSVNCNSVETAPHQCNQLPWLVSPGSAAKMVGTFILSPLIFEPGTLYGYSNPNFILAAYFVEKYSGQGFQQYLKENIFDPIGLEDTYYDYWNAELEIDTRRPLNYYKYYANLTPFELLSVGAAREFDLGAIGGSGGLVSTAQDMVTWYHALFNKTTGGAPLFRSPDTQQAIIAPITLIEDIGDNGGVYVYFGQGVVVACAEEMCPTGPDFLFYRGATATVTTTIFMEYGTADMSISQVWTSTKVMLTSAQALQYARENPSGTFNELTAEWQLAFEELFSVLGTGSGTASTRQLSNALRY